MSAKFCVFIAHGAYGDPRENWIPWIKKELEKEGHEVIVPAFPTPEGQTWENWQRIATEALTGHAPGRTVLIGHSIGAAFVLRLAELSSEPFRSVFALCPFLRGLGLPAFDPLNVTFLRHAFIPEKIKRGARRIVCMAGDNDPYVPLAMAEETAETAGGELVIVKNGGHLNAKAGLTEFPLLLEKIRECA